LHLYHNTIISTRSGNTTLIRLSSADESLDARNNVIYNTAGGNYFAIAGSEGRVVLTNNWLPIGWRNSHSGFNGTVTPINNIEGLDPEFKNVASQDFHFLAGASAINAGTSLSVGAESHPVMSEYVRHQDHQVRVGNSTPTMGAFSNVN